jgi:hypothetical protein
MIKWGKQRKECRVSEWTRGIQTFPPPSFLHIHRLGDFDRATRLENRAAFGFLVCVFKA